VRAASGVAGDACWASEICVERRAAAAADAKNVRRFMVVMDTWS
jgi:hypothetical protein